MNTTYLSCADIAARYGVKKETVHAWVRRGELRAARLGKSYFIKSEDLEEFEAVRFGRPQKGDPR